MSLAHKAGTGRRSCLWSIFAAMADAARYASIPVPFSRGFSFPGFLFLGFLTYGRPDDQQGCNDRKAHNFFHHDKFILLANLHMRRLSFEYSKYTKIKLPLTEG
jgi:hypothetical protein